MSLGLMFSSLKLYWTESWVGVGGIGGTRGRFLAWEGCVDMAGSCGNGRFVLGGNEESTIFFFINRKQDRSYKCKLTLERTLTKTNSD